MECLVVVRAEGPDRFSAQAMGVPEMKAVAATEAEAIEKISESLAQWLGSARLVRVEVPSPGAGNPWLDTFGRSATDPDFEEFMTELERGRAARAE